MTDDELERKIINGLDSDRTARDLASELHLPMPLVRTKLHDMEARNLVTVKREAGVTRWARRVRER